MRSLSWAALAAVALAAPQDINFDLADSLPNPTFTVATGVTAQVVTYVPSTILAAAQSQITASQAEATDAAPSDASNQKRAACASQPLGYGPVPSPDTASNFAAFASFSNAALAAPTPSGYSLTFQNWNGSNNAYGYMGFTTLTSYDPNACAAQCNKINGCMSINIYFERDPTLNPGSTCSNPSSTTNIKCVFWGGPVTQANAVNYGQFRQQFQVVIAGSNGYTNNSIIPPPGYTQPLDLGNAAINAPYDIYGANTFLGSAIFNSGPFNASLCATACSQKSAYAIAHPPIDGSPAQTCQFYNTYLLYINTTSDMQGQYCAMYSESWSAQYATNVGQYRGSDHFLIEYSYAYSNSTNPGAPNQAVAVAQATQVISAATLQPFCSAFLGYVASTTTTTTTTTGSASFITITVTATATAINTDTTTTTITTGSSQPYAKRFVATPVSTPNQLTRFPSAILSSACLGVISSSPLPSTVVITDTIVPTSTETDTTTATTTTTTTAIATTAVPDFYCPPKDIIQGPLLSSGTQGDLHVCTYQYSFLDDECHADGDEGNETCNEVTIYENIPCYYNPDGTAQESNQGLCP